MDNLFSFPSTALSASSSTQPSASDAPAQALSAGATPASSASEMTEESENTDEALRPADTPSTDLHVRLKLLDERVFDVYVDRAIVVADFRATVERVTAISASLQRLIYRGKLLKDSARLASYDIQDGHTIHLVTKPAASSTSTSTAVASTATEPPLVRDHDDERERLDRFIGRSRERLRQTMEGEEGQQHHTNNGLSEAGIPRPSPPLTGLSRVRRPGYGEPTGDAWNLAVLREALSQHSDRIPARASNRDAASMDMLRQDTEQRQMAQNDSPTDTATNMGLHPTLATEQPQQPNLDYISQGIWTLRTVLSTAAVPQEQEMRVESEVTEQEDATASEDEVATQQQQSHQVATPSGSPRRGRRRFFVGQWLDVKDTVNQWLECTVMDMSDDKVLVHYHGWPSRWDEWLDFDSPRIAAFRTRTPHTQHAVHLSPAPSTRLPNAPNVGENDMRRIVPQIRDLMEEVLPYVDQLATLCEDEEDQDERRREELSDMAHLLAPFFDRFGRLLVDSARQLDPLLHPDLRHDERRRRLVRARGAAPSRQTAPPSTTPEEDTAISMRDLITPATRPPQEVPGARRSIDVHIHAIVAPSSLSSLASLARLGTALAGAMGSSSQSNSPALGAQQRASNEGVDAFGMPLVRPLQGGSGDRSLLTDITEPDDEDARYTDTSRTPLLSSFRRSSSRSNYRDTSSIQRGEADTVRRTSRRAERSSSSSTRLHEFLSDDFFGPSFSQDSDDMDDPIANGGEFGTPDRSHDDVVLYQEIPSPREIGQRPRSENENESVRIGVIPEVEEAQRRERERRAQQENSSSDDAGRASSSSSAASSSGYPTFLEVMRRTLSGVRNFGFSSSSSSLQSEETSASASGSATATTAQRATRSASDSAVSDASASLIDTTFEVDALADARAVLQSSDPVRAFSRLRQPSSVSSIEEDLDSVD